MTVMTNVLAHPFALAGNAVAVVDDGSDTGAAQEIALLCATRLGERELVPGYGIPDPAFDALELAEINAGLTLYGPPGVSVTDLAVTLDPTGLIAAAVLTFDRTD